MSGKRPKPDPVDDRDEQLLSDPDLAESLAQMRRGEGSDFQFRHPATDDDK